MESYLNLIQATKMSVCQNYPAGNFVWCCSGAVNNLYEIIIYIYFEQQNVCLFVCLFARIILLASLFASLYVTIVEQFIMNLIFSVTKITSLFTQIWVLATLFASLLCYNCGAFYNELNIFVTKITCHLRRPLVCQTCPAVCTQCFVFDITVSLGSWALVVQPSLCSSFYFLFSFNLCNEKFLTKILNIVKYTADSFKKYSTLGDSLYSKLWMLLARIIPPPTVIRALTMISRI